MCESLTQIILQNSCSKLRYNHDFDSKDKPIIHRPYLSVISIAENIKNSL